MSRAYGVHDLLRKKFTDLPLEGEFKKLLGSPERTGSWIVWGDSGHGKTTFLMQLCKQLAQHEKVEYNTLEEGARKSMAMNVKDNNMQGIPYGRFKILDKMPIDKLRERLARPRSAKIIVIDSLQYAFLTIRDYKQLLIDFPHHLFIWVSHARGRKPEGRLASAVRYDADVKIHVEGFRASATSRLNRGQVQEPYTIWEQGAANYWNKI